MKKGMFFFIAALVGVLAMASACPAQTGEEGEAAYSRDANRSVNVYGPQPLADLAGQAIQENRPDVVVVEHYKRLNHKVWIEGTTGSGYMPLSPKRVRLMEAAKAGGRSVYAALCEEQKGVIQRTVGVRTVCRPVEREYRVVTRTYYVRPVYPPPPPPPVYVYPANVAYGCVGCYPFYAYGGYAGWRGSYGWYGGGYRYYHGGYRGAYYRGRR